MTNYSGSIYAMDNDDKSVLMYAAESESAVNLISIINLLQESNVIDSKDKNGKTALMYAVGGPYNVMIKQQRLMQSGANPAAADVVSHHGLAVTPCIFDPSLPKRLIKTVVCVFQEDHRKHNMLIFRRFNFTAQLVRSIP